jgi:acetamidase/formamidase
VTGAEPGDSLVVEILDVEPIEWGVATLIPGYGQLIEKVQAPFTRLFKVEDGVVEMNERVRFPARPMVGVVGVATAAETLPNGLAGQNGGNFAVGDMHASMDDGEVCFTGVEIAGAVTMRFDLLKGKQATWPVTELPDRWIPHATADAFSEALDLVTEEAARMLVDQWGFTIEDAFIFLSVACDAGVAQACKPAPHFGHDRALLDPVDRRDPAAVRVVEITNGERTVIPRGTPLPRVTNGPPHVTVPRPWPHRTKSESGSPTGAPSRPTRRSPSAPTSQRSSPRCPRTSAAST